MKKLFIVVAVALFMVTLASATCSPVVIGTTSNKNAQGTGPTWDFTVEGNTVTPGSTYYLYTTDMILGWTNTGYVLVPGLFGGCTDNLYGLVDATFTVKDLNTGVEVWTFGTYINFNCGFTYTCHFDDIWPGKTLGTSYGHLYQVTEAIYAWDQAAGIFSKTYTESILIKRENRVPLTVEPTN